MSDHLLHLNCVFLPRVLPAHCIRRVIEVRLNTDLVKSTRRHDLTARVWRCLTCSLSSSRVTTTTESISSALHPLSSWWRWLTALLPLLFFSCLSPCQWLFKTKWIMQFERLMIDEYWWLFLLLMVYCCTLTSENQGQGLVAWLCVYEREKPWCVCVRETRRWRDRVCVPVRERQMYLYFDCS